MPAFVAGDSRLQFNCCQAALFEELELGAVGDVTLLQASKVCCLPLTQDTARFLCSKSIYCQGTHPAEPGCAQQQ